MNIDFADCFRVFCTLSEEKKRLKIELEKWRIRRMKRVRVRTTRNIILPSTGRGGPIYNKLLFDVRTLHRVKKPFRPTRKRFLSPPPSPLPPLHAAMFHVPIGRFSSPLRSSEPCIGQNKSIMWPIPRDMGMGNSCMCVVKSRPFHSLLKACVKFEFYARNRKKRGN